MGHLNIRQVTHSPLTGLHLHTAYTKLLSGDLGYIPDKACYTTPPNSLPHLWEQCNGPTFIRPQRQSGYIGPADIAPPPP